MNEKLEQKLNDYKAILYHVLASEIRNGFDLRYDEGSISFTYTPVSGMLLVERHHRGHKPLKLFKEEDEHEAFKYCFNQMITYIRDNFQIHEGEIHDRHIGFSKHYRILSFSMEAINGMRETAFGKLSKKQQDRINNERARRGFGPAQSYVRVRNHDKVSRSARETLERKMRVGFNYHTKGEPTERYVQKVLEAEEEAYADIHDQIINE